MNSTTDKLLTVCIMFVVLTLGVETFMFTSNRQQIDANRERIEKLEQQIYIRRVE